MRSFRSGATHVASARRNFLAAADPDVGAGTRPCVPPDPESPTASGSMLFSVAMSRSVGAPVLLERPLTVGPVMLANFALLTTPGWIVVVIDDVPDPATSDDSVIVWSPVLVPLRLLPETAPEAATLVGVIAPRLSATVPVDVMGEPLLVMPLAPLTETEVTVPPPDAARICATVALLLVEVLPSTMTV